MAKMLEVGDVIYELNHGKMMSRMKVTRVTAKRAYTKLNDVAEMEFKREFDDDGQVYKTKSKNIWDAVCYGISTPEMDALYKHTRLVQKLRSKDWSAESLETLEKVMKVFE